MDAKKNPSNDIYLPFDVEGRLQIKAGIGLLEQSRLVTWSQEKICFMPVNREVFEVSWKKEVDPIYGRFICWILFSSGAELFVKGLCLVNQVEVRCIKTVRSYPSSGDVIELWAKKTADALRIKLCREKNEKYQFPGQKHYITDYGTLNDLFRGRECYFKGKYIKLEPSFSKLFKIVNATEDEENLILASYDLLRETIRNRDAHAYVPNVRDAHVNLVSELFTDCFNIFVKWLPGGADAINKWREDGSNS